MTKKKISKTVRKRPNKKAPSPQHIRKSLELLRNIEAILTSIISENHDLLKHYKQTGNDQGAGRTEKQMRAARSELKGIKAEFNCIRPN